MTDDNPVGRYVKSAAELMAVGLALIYVAGYLVLRSEISVLGIPSGVDTFDHRYLFSGASFLVYSLQSIPGHLLPFALLTLLLVGFVRLTKIIARKGWRTGLVLTSPPIQAGALTVAAAVLCVVSIALMSPYLRVRNLLLDSRNPTAFQAVLSAEDPDSEADAIYSYHFFALLASVALLLTAAIRWKNGVRWMALTIVLVAIQCMLLPLLFGALNVGRERPRVKLADGETGILVWEDNDSFTLVLDATSKLERRSKSGQKKVEFSGLGRAGIAKGTPAVNQQGN